MYRPIYLSLVLLYSISVPWTIERAIVQSNRAEFVNLEQITLVRALESLERQGRCAFMSRGVGEGFVSTGRVLSIQLGLV